MIKLDLGCGPRKKAGFLGIDISDFEGVDIIRDLRRGIPLSDNTVDEVWCSHIIEHFCQTDLLFLIDEIWRVCISGAAIWIITPDATSSNAYKDPMHVSFWYPDSFDFWKINEQSGEHIIFAGPLYQRKAKLRLDETGINSNLDRIFKLRVLK